MSVNWVACGACYTKTEGTELGGIEDDEVSFFVFVSSETKRIYFDFRVDYLHSKRLRVAYTLFEGFLADLL